MKIVISIPAYNEATTIAGVLQNIKRVMQERKYNYVVSVVDDGSKDNTAEIARSEGAIVTSHPYNYGLAEAFKTEIKKAIELNADVIVHTDADGQYSAEDIPRLLCEIEAGASLVLGSRFLGKIDSMPLTKRLGNIAFSQAISHICKVKITDAQTGFRAFTKDVAKLGIISTHTYTQEQIIRAIKNKYLIKEIPINTKKTRPSRLMRSHPVIQPFEYAIKAWVNLLRIYRDFEPLKFFGYLGSIFFTAGILLGSTIFFFFLQTGKVGHMPATILTMLLITTAIQIWVFGLLADMNKK